MCWKSALYTTGNYGRMRIAAVPVAMAGGCRFALAGESAVFPGRSPCFVLAIEMQSMAQKSRINQTSFKHMQHQPAGDARPYCSGDYSEVPI